MAQQIENTGQQFSNRVVKLNYTAAEIEERLAMVFENVDKIAANAQIIDKLDDYLVDFPQIQLNASAITALKKVVDKRESSIFGADFDTIQEAVDALKAEYKSGNKDTKKFDSILEALAAAQLRFEAIEAKLVSNPEETPIIPGGDPGVAAIVNKLLGDWPEDEELTVWQKLESIKSCDCEQLAAQVQDLSDALDATTNTVNELVAQVDKMPDTVMGQVKEYIDIEVPEGSTVSKVIDDKYMDENEVNAVVTEKMKDYSFTTASEQEVKDLF